MEFSISRPDDWSCACRGNLAARAARPRMRTLGRMAYKTASGPALVEEEIKGSRFLGLVLPLEDVNQFETWLEGIRNEHPAATHHCWAYRFGEEMRFSDDGEPGGTAGRPMLEVLLRRDLDRTGVVVVRYFGGKLLGAGGLVRAYSGTAAKALDSAGEREVEDRETLRIGVNYQSVDVVHRLVAETRAAVIGSEEYDSVGWNFELELPAAESAGFRKRLVDSTRGSARIKEVEGE